MNAHHSKSQSRGGFATILVALTMVPILGMSGLAIDLGRCFVVRDRLAAATDAAALAGAADPNTATQQQRAQNTFTANFPKGILGVAAPTLVNSTVEPVQATTVATMAGQANVPPTILLILTGGAVPVVVDSVATSQSPPAPPLLTQ